jgi:16S rRNA G966 N2-methylase RsmD
MSGIQKKSIGQALPSFEKALAELEIAKSPREVKSLKKIADAVASIEGDTELGVRASVFSARAWRKLGELTVAIEGPGSGTTAHGKRPKVGPLREDLLRAEGTNKAQAQRAEAILALDADTVFEPYIQACLKKRERVSAKGLLEIAALKDAERQRATAKKAADVGPRRAKKEAERERREEEAASVVSTETNARLLVGDLLDVGTEIDDESVDVIITDPPYPREYLPVYQKLADLAERVLRPGGSCVVMVGQSYLPEIMDALRSRLNYQWTLAYLTPGGQATQIHTRNVNTFWKPLLWFVKGSYEGRWIGDVTRSEVNDNDKRFHHWGQSESGMRDVIERLSEPGDTVLDPFCGGGTTGVDA